MTEALTVLVADDQDLVREGFALILDRAGVEVVGQARDGVEAVELARQHRPDVVLMDVRMPRLDGIGATRSVVREVPETKVLVLTTFDLDEYVADAVRAGANGFLLKDVRPDDLVHAVRVVARGESMVAPVRSVQTPAAVATFRSPATMLPGVAEAAAFQLASDPPPPSNSAAPTAMAAVPLIRVLFFMMCPLRLCLLGWKLSCWEQQCTAKRRNISRKKAKKAQVI